MQIPFVQTLLPLILFILSKHVQIMISFPICANLLPVQISSCFSNKILLSEVQTCFENKGFNQSQFWCYCLNLIFLLEIFELNINWLILKKKIFSLSLLLTDGFIKSIKLLFLCLRVKLLFIHSNPISDPVECKPSRFP